MRILVDRDYLLPYFTVIKTVEHEEDKRVRFEIGDEITVYPDISQIYAPSMYRILNITSKIVVLEFYGKCYYEKIEDLEKRIKI